MDRPDYKLFTIFNSHNTVSSLLIASSNTVILTAKEILAQPIS